MSESTSGPNGCNVALSAEAHLLGTDDRRVWPADDTSQDLLPVKAARERRTFKWWVATLSAGRIVYFPKPATQGPRYGHGKRAHPLLLDMFRQRDAAYASLLQGLAEFKPQFRRIPQVPFDAKTPFWRNGWLPPFDAVALYGMLVRCNPAHFIEVGSGNSTKFARRAIQDHQLRTELVSIDPNPRVEVDSLCDEVIRSPLECMDLNILRGLRADDMLFIDSSHRVLMNSDVTALFLDVLPVLPVGVAIHFHDVWLPYDYPMRWRLWHFSEQYMLAAVLLSSPRYYEILLPCMYASIHPELSSLVRSLCTQTGAVSVMHGASFWLRVNPSVA